MNNKIFGEMTFNMGWKSTMDIFLFKRLTKVVIKVKGYYEKDGITNEQENSFLHFNSNKEEILTKLEKLVGFKYTDVNQFVPKILLFERDGSYTLLLDDLNDIDNGLAIVLFPEMKLLSQDDYL